MGIHQLRYFLAVCETQNFTRAAERCNVAQPSLTRAIQQLEEELGARLFVRGRVAQELTPLGRFVRGHVEHIARRIDLVRTAVSCWRNADSAPLRIGVLESASPLRVAEVVRRFQMHHPEVDVEVEECDLESVMRGLEDGSLEVAIGAPHPAERQFRWHSLYEDALVVAFAADHRFAEFTVIRLADLAEEKAYIDCLNCEMRTRLLREGGPRNLVLRAGYRCNRPEWIQALVAMGVGVAILPESSISMPGLLNRPLIEPSIHREVGMMTLGEHEPSPAAHAFILQAIATPPAASRAMRDR